MTSVDPNLIPKALPSNATIVALGLQLRNCRGHEGVAWPPVASVTMYSHPDDLGQQELILPQSWRQKSGSKV
jgi:hypothetical protein